MVLEEENFELMFASQEFRREGEDDRTLAGSLNIAELLATFSELPWLREWGRCI